MPLTWRAVGALSASLALLPVLAPSAAIAVTIPAPPSKHLPTALDIAPAYQTMRYCSPVAKPGPIAFAKLLNATYGTHVYGISRACGSGVTEHSEGRALDWMISARNANSLALGNAITSWLAAPDAHGRPGAMARRFGINYIIWNRHMWRAYDPGRGWAPYTGVSPHTDHIHFTFTWDGAYQQTSWRTGVALTAVRLTGPVQSTISSPAPYAGTTIRFGSTGAAVSTLQRALGGLSIDGQFGARTNTAVRHYQKARGLPVNGIVGSSVWKVLMGGSVATAPPTTTAYTAYKATTLRTGSSGRAVRVLQRGLGGLAVDGSYGARTASAVAAFRRANGLPAASTVDRSVWNALEAKDYPLLRWYGVVVRQGSVGTAVASLQKALRASADGEFGPVTQAAVKAAQGRAGISRTGVVATMTWKAIEKRYTGRGY